MLILYVPLHTYFQKTRTFLLYGTGFFLLILPFVIILAYETNTTVLNRNI